jgi:hypothetical protein
MENDHEGSSHYATFINPHPALHSAKAPSMITYATPYLFRAASAHLVFEAEASDGSLYSVNIITGVVLVDGNPPGRLPCRILEHNMYVRSFGAFDFDVFKTATNELMTTRRINGCQYKFKFTTNYDTLSIFEMSHDNTLLLLDGTNSKLWAPNMPIRLREMCSHWYDENRNMTLLRPVLFSQHDVKYIIHDARTAPHIMCVPTHEQEEVLSFSAHRTRQYDE